MFVGGVAMGIGCDLSISWVPVNQAIEGVKV